MGRWAQARKRGSSGPVVVSSSGVPAPSDEFWSIEYNDPFQPNIVLGAYVGPPGPESCLSRYKKDGGAWTAGPFCVFEGPTAFDGGGAGHAFEVQIAFDNDIGDQISDWSNSKFLP